MMAAILTRLALLALMAGGLVGAYWYAGAQILGAL